MKLPKQLPAVERSTNKAAVVPEGAHMGQSGWFDDVLGVAKTVAPAVGGIASLF